MSLRVSVVIPSKNEERWIEASVRSAFDAGASEVIVTDGRSSDGTAELGRSAGAKVFEIDGNRAGRMNDGFERALGDVVCFLHADTTLPENACQAMTIRVEKGVEFGGFLLSFAERGPRLAIAAFMVNARTRLTRAPWGDQAQFFARDGFESAGRYADVPIMEDYDMAMRMKRRSRPAIVPSRVVTSGRRFLELGLIRTAVTNWRIVLAWHRGASPAELRRLYGSR